MASSLLTVVRDLQRPRGRERRELTLAEGVRLVEEAVARGIEITGAVVSPALEKGDRGVALLESLSRNNTRIERVSDKDLAEIADTEHPQGVVAIVRPRQWAFKDLDIVRNPAVLVLDGIQDPGNVGTLLRTAQGLGAAGVVALPGTVELTNPKVVRGSMGALFSLPSVVAGPDDFTAWCKERQLPLIIAAADGEPLGRSPLPRPAGIVLGNEGAGVSPALRKAGRAVAIPLASGTESLNVAVAGGILLFEVLK
ncbi:MAG: RNA methyltransferase [Gemmatimonadota bacterium]